MCDSGVHTLLALSLAAQHLPAWQCHLRYSQSSAVVIAAVFSYHACTAIPSVDERVRKAQYDILTAHLHCNL
jgi:hypothetical protein